MGALFPEVQEFDGPWLIFCTVLVGNTLRLLVGAQPEDIQLTGYYCIVLLADFLISFSQCKVVK